MARPVYLQQQTYLVTAGTAVECQQRKSNSETTDSRQGHVAVRYVGNDALRIFAGKVRSRNTPDSLFGQAPKTKRVPV